MFLSLSTKERLDQNPGAISAKLMFLFLPIHRDKLGNAENGHYEPTQFIKAELILLEN